MISDREEQKVDSKIDDYFKDQKQADYDVIVDELTEEFECYRDDIERVLNRKIREGQLFEPEPGKLERLDA